MKCVITKGKKYESKFDKKISFFHFDWWQFFKNVFFFPVQEYDLIINDFEPVVAWACQWRKKTCYGLSHQEAVANPMSPKPSGDFTWSKWILKNYAPCTYAFGFHCKSYDAHIYTPIIRPKVRHLQSINAGHYTVYLPSYNHHHLAKFLSQFPEVHWHVFSKDAGVNFYFNNGVVRNCFLNQFFSFANWNHTLIN